MQEDRSETFVRLCTLQSGVPHMTGSVTTACFWAAISWCLVMITSTCGKSRASELMHIGFRSSSPQYSPACPTAQLGFGSPPMNVVLIFELLHRVEEQPKWGALWGITMPVLFRGELGCQHQRKMQGDKQVLLALVSQHVVN